MRFKQATLLMLMTLFGLEKGTATAEGVRECTDQSVVRPLLVLTEFSSNQILGQDAQPNTRKILDELLGSSLMRRTTDGYQSLFFSSWQSNVSMTTFDLFLNDAYKDKTIASALEKAIRTTLFDSGLVEGHLKFDEKNLSFHIESKTQRPRFLDYLTQIYPKLPSDISIKYVADGPYHILCQKHEGTVLRLKRVTPHAGYPEVIDISTNDIDYDKATFVLSPMFSDEKHGFYDNYLSNHRTTLVLLALNTKNKAVLSEPFRKLLSCNVNQLELSLKHKPSRLNHTFYPIDPMFCDKNTKVQLLARIPKKIRNQTLSIVYDGYEPPSAKVLEQQLKSSGLKVKMSPARGGTTEIGQIISIPILGIEPALSIKSLCNGKSQWIPECRGLALRDKLLSHKSQNIASLVSPLFANHYMIPLVYVPYTFLTRRALVDHYEENATELLNLDRLVLSSIGIDADSSKVKTE